MLARRPRIAAIVTARIGAIVTLLWAAPLMLPAAGIRALFWRARSGRLIGVRLTRVLLRGAIAVPVALRSMLAIAVLVRSPLRALTICIGVRLLAPFLGRLSGTCRLLGLILRRPRSAFPPIAIPVSSRGAIVTPLALPFRPFEFRLWPAEPPDLLEFRFGSRDRGDGRALVGNGVGNRLSR